MPDLNPMVAGDVPYPQYSVTETLELEANGTFVKGTLLSLEGTGRLDVSTPTTFAKGLYQLAADFDNSGATAGENSIQVLSPRTRIIVIAADVTPVIGADVIFNANVAEGANVVAGLKTSVLYIGKVFEIYTRNSDGTRKRVPAIGDRIVVETVLT